METDSYLKGLLMERNTLRKIIFFSAFLKADGLQGPEQKEVAVI